jgi:hypothetical protein
VLLASLFFMWGFITVIGRFAGAFIMRRLPANRVLAGFAGAAFAVMLCAASLHGPIAMWALILVGLAHSIMFPTIFALGIKGLGPLTEEGSGLLITAIAGGSLVVAQGWLADHYRRQADGHAQHRPGSHGLGHGLEVMPGFMTPSEAFAALRAGARRLKLFPAAVQGTGTVKAVREVLPRDIGVWAVGGVDAANAAGWLSARAEGIAIGGALFRPGVPAGEVALTARAFVAAIGKG